MESVVMRAEVYSDILCNSSKDYADKIVDSLLAKSDEELRALYYIHTMAR